MQIRQRGRGQPDAGRQHLSRAITLDPSYGDAIYNLATLEYDVGGEPTPESLLAALRALLS